MRMQGKIVAITGIGSGMGREAALRFQREGAQVYGSDINADALSETQRLSEQQDGSTVITRSGVDITDPERLRAWIDEVGDNAGRIDVLYNNASFAQFGAIDEMSVDAWRSSIDAELNAVFYAARAAWPHLKKSHGVIINIGSIAGTRGVEYQPQNAHGAAKAGVINLTQQLAVEGGPHKIRVVSISPGFVHTAATDPAVQNPPKELQENWNRIPLGRIGEPDDIVSAAVFLASDEASWITGINLVVDGGSTILG